MRDLRPLNLIEVFVCLLSLIRALNVVTFRSNARTYNSFPLKSSFLSAFFQSHSDDCRLKFRNAFTQLVSENTPTEVYSQYGDNIYFIRICINPKLYSKTN